MKYTEAFVHILALMVTAEHLAADDSFEAVAQTCTDLIMNNTPVSVRDLFIAAQTLDTPEEEMIKEMMPKGRPN